MAADICPNRCILGTLDMSTVSKICSNVQFYNPSCWAWWPFKLIESGTDCVEEINGNTGFAILSHHQTNNNYNDGNKGKADQTARVSRISTVALHATFLSVTEREGPFKTRTPSQTETPTIAGTKRKHPEKTTEESLTLTVERLRRDKRSCSRQYEARKDQLCTSHPLFREWIRRSG